MQKSLHWVVGSLLFGVLATRTSITQGLDSSELQLIQNTLGIRPDLAHVTDAQWPSEQTLPDFILIQDVHRHPQVQSQIASLIVHGYSAWGVKKQVFLEGAFTSLDLFDLSSRAQQSAFAAHGTLGEGRRSFRSGTCGGDNQ